MNLDGEMKLKPLHHRGDAVAGVIEALLLVALISIVLGFIQINYIPDIMKQREAEQMDYVANQFSTLKSMMDLQAITQSDAPISTMFTLGNRELPYFASVPSFADIGLDNDEESQIKIVSNATGIYTYDLTSLIYNADNSYFERQQYILEGGGIILKQSSDKTVMRVDPSLRFVEGSSITVDLDLPILKSIPGKESQSGNRGQISFVRTNYSPGASDTISDVYKINITTRYPDAWNDTLSAYFEETMNYSVGENYVQLRKRTTKDISLTIDYYYIYAQVGIGWVK